MEKNLAEMETKMESKLIVSAEKVETEAEKVPEYSKDEKDNNKEKENKSIPADVITKKDIKAAVEEIKEAISNAGLWFNTELRKQIHITPKGWELRGVG